MGTPRGNTSLRTHDSVVRRSGSSPLDTLTTSVPRLRAAPTRPITSRTTCDGADDTTTSAPRTVSPRSRSEEHTSELQSRSDLVCRLLLEKKKKHNNRMMTMEE